jgi:hypothetical protein
MQKRIIYFYKALITVTSLVASTLFGIGIFGSFIHEASHAMVGVALGLKITSWSNSMVTFSYVPNEPANLLTLLAGGAGEAWVAFGSFLIVLGIAYYCIFKEDELDTGANWSMSDVKRRVLPPLFFGIEVAFLSFVFHGIIGALWEGFFNSSYFAFSGNPVLELFGIAACLLMAFGLLYRRQKKYLILTVETRLSRDE